MQTDLKAVAAPRRQKPILQVVSVYVKYLEIDAKSESSEKKPDDQNGV